MSYGGEAEFTGKSITQSRQEQLRLAAIKQQQIAQENLAVQQQRQIAPGTVARGSPQDVAIRQEEAQAAQQRMVSENVHQVGYTGDIFAAEREAAIKSGRFDYSGVRSAFYSPPAIFVTAKGERVTRPTPTPPPSGPPRDLSTLTPAATPSPTPSVSGAPLDISAAQLARTDALRAQMGLPPLEQAERVTVVKGTQSLPVKPTPKPVSTQSDVRSVIGAAMSQAEGIPEQMKEGEAVSLFTMPLERTLAKTPLAFLFKPPPPSTQQGTKEVPATGIVDVLQFLPFGLGLAEKGAAFVRTLPEAFVKEFGPKVEETAVSAGKGAADIGTNVPKYTEQFRTEKNIQDMIREKMKSPLPIARAGLTSTETSLGTGLGKVISKGGEAGKPTDIFGKPPPETPKSAEEKAKEDYFKAREEYAQKRAIEQGMILRKTEKGYSTKEVQTSSGILEQLSKEKEVTKTIRKKPEFEQRQATKQEQFLKQQEEKALKEQEAKPKTEGEQVQKTSIKQIIPTPPKPTEGEGVGFLITLQKQKEEKPAIPSIKTTPPPPDQVLIPIFTTLQQTKQKEQFNLGGFPVFTPPPSPEKETTPPPPPPPPPLIPPPTTTGEPTKRPPPPDLLGLGAGLTGGGGRGEGQGAVKAFIGNVPEASIVGVYKRGEISYGSSSFKASKASTRKTISEKKIKLL